MKSIDFAIDLGTTNSLIARQQMGKVEVFKNPVGHKETLPSVVAFRPGRILVGDKAREYQQKDPENIVGGFKRKMGTQETYFIERLAETKNPMELSTLVLRELKNFIYSGEQPRSVVVTIPASFDTVQSNATKKAGLDAGFEEVVLLQEPIAACLAFANKDQNEDKSGHWLVYDLGGGTFDVALVRIDDTDLKVVDHKGDNFLGGLDFDNLLIEQVILPQLYEQPLLAYLKDEAAQRSRRFMRLYYELLYKAETAKKELSSVEETDIEFAAPTADGEDEVDMLITISREQFHDCIREKLSYSISLIREVLDANEMATSDIKQVVLVGGSTYIPLVRELISVELGIPINASVDPTTAVVVGAAHYAGSKTARLEASADAPPANTSLTEGSTDISIRLSYPRSSKEAEEMVLAVVENYPEDARYRISREDGGFDTGLRPVKTKFTESLTLLPQNLNRFRLRLFDAQQNELPVQVEPIEISQGLYGVDGQPLPHDICLEVDDKENNTTRLEVIFEKNSILPLRKTIYREVSKTIYRDSEDTLIVNILEGDRFASPGTNQVIGVIEVKPADLEADLVRGSDVEIELEISESRDIAVTVYLSQTGQEFKDVFSPTERYLSVSKLHDDAQLLHKAIAEDLRDAERKQNYEQASLLQEYLEEAVRITRKTEVLHLNLNSDEKYHLEERKRKLAQKFDQVNRDHKLTGLREEYINLRESINYQLEQSNAGKKPEFERRFNELTKDESSLLRSQSRMLIQTRVKALNQLHNEMLYHSDPVMIHWYLALAAYDISEFLDKRRAKKLLEQGEKAMERQSYEELRAINVQLSSLLPDNKAAEELQIKIKGTGLE